MTGAAVFAAVLGTYLVAHLDQSWHWLWLGIAALITTGP